MSIKKNLFYNIVLNISNVLFPFITVPYVSRVLGPEGVGITGFATTFASYFALLAALGIPVYGIREVSKVRGNIEELSGVFSELFVINLISTVIFSVFYLLSVFTIPLLFEQKVPLLIAGFLLYLSTFSIDWYFSGRENFKVITIRSIVVKILSVIALFVWVREPDDVIPYLILIVFSQIGNQLWNFSFLWKDRIKIKFFDLKLRRHLKPLLYLYVSAIAVSIYTMLDTLMLGFMSNYEEVGYYTSAIKISRVLIPIITGLGVVLLPRLVYYKDKGEMEEIISALSKSFSFVLFFAFPLTVSIIITAPEFVPLFFGQDFMGVVLPLQILSFLLLAIGISNLSGLQVLVGLGYDKLFMRSVLIGVFVNFTLNILMIPELGASGAALASVTAEIIIAIISIYYSIKFANIHFFSYSLFFKNMLVSLFLIPIYWLLGFWGATGWLKLVVFGIFGMILYMLIQRYCLKNIVCLEVVGLVKSKLIGIKNKLGN